MAQVFISYAHVKPDQELASELCRFLIQNGISVFIDSKIRLGQNWSDQIDVNLRTSEYFVVLISAGSMQSDMVRREIAVAHELKKEGKITILPVRIDFHDTLPYQVGAYLDLIQYAMWNPGESFARVCSAVLDAITGRTTLSGLPKRSPDPARFPQPELEVVIEDLAKRIGPLARVLVKRAAEKATDWNDLYRLLEPEIPDARERRSFKASMRH